MLITRILTASVLLPAVIGLVLYGKGTPFLVLVGAVTVLCSLEYFRMFFPASARDRWGGVALAVLAFLLGACLPPGVPFADCRLATGCPGPSALAELAGRAGSLPYQGLPAAWLVLVPLALFHFLPGGRPLEEKVRGAGIMLVGVFYIGGLLSLFPRVIAVPSGEHWVLMTVVAAVAGDTFAYFTGRFLGRRKLASRISPNKTVEGAAGGLAGSVVCATAYAHFLLPGVPAPWAAGAAALIGVAGQAGDLFESLLKRVAGVKDSGTIVPGHGGMFDRADSLIAAAPALHLVVTLFALSGGAA